MEERAGDRVVVGDRHQRRVQRVGLCLAVTWAAVRARHEIV
jgi:hypothetical protein